MTFINDFHQVIGFQNESSFVIRAKKFNEIIVV